MQTSTGPRILMVDDRPDDQRQRQRNLSTLATTVLLHPRDVLEQHLRDADLVLVDLTLDDWPEREQASALSLKPPDGLALAAVLRAHAEGHEGHSPTAFAILSAHLSNLTHNLPPDPRAHTIARSHNLEWVFAKNRNPGEESLEDQIAILARAVRSLPSQWPLDNVEQIHAIVADLLGLPERNSSAWQTRSWEDVMACHPPIHELVDTSHGLAFMRWLLQRILPYPCFLWDSNWLAARLRISYESLEKALGEDSALHSRLEDYRYSGILANFLGPRWWRSGIESFVWNITQGDPFDSDALLNALSPLSDTTLQSRGHAQTVICVDKDYRPLRDSVSIEDAVRIQPDDWPPYADQAWTTVDLADSVPQLAALRADQQVLLSEEQ